MSDCYKPAPADRRVIANREIADTIWEMVIAWSSEVVAPGTFVMIKPAGDTALPLGRPISVADCADDGTTLTIIYRVVGVGTAALAKLSAGALVTVLGPLGQGFPLSGCGGELEGDDDVVAAPNAGRALLVGGGVGIPPLYLLGRRLREHGWQVIFELGLRSANEIFWNEQFAELGKVYWATDDGSAGTAGTVASIELLPEDSQPDAVYSCGPLPMLRHVKKRWLPVCPTFVSVEQRMACGVGACYACVIPDAHDHEHQYRICYDGPVFPAQNVTV